MNYRSALKMFSIRHALSVGAAVLVAFIIQHYFSFSKEYWIVITAFLVSQTTRGTPLRQSLGFSLTIIIAILIASLLVILIKQLILIYGILGIIFISSGYLIFLNRPLQNKTFFLIILFSVVLLIAVLVPTHSSLLIANRIIDTAIGGLIGILFSQFFLPVRYDKEFRQGIVPILKALKIYSQGLSDCLQQNVYHELAISQKRIQVENTLQTQYGIYPEWVYEAGFNPGLRSGFRFFLINLEQITEIFFSLDYLTRRQSNILPTLDLKTSELTTAMFNAMQKNEELINILIEYFSINKLKDSVANFTSDISELETALRQVVPSSLELLDISPEYIVPTAITRDIKDLRGLLLQLVMALPS